MRAAIEESEAATSLHQRRGLNMKRIVSLVALSTASIVALNCGVTISEPIDDEGEGGSDSQSSSSSSGAVDGCGCPWVSEPYGGTSSVGVTSGGAAMLGYGFAVSGGDLIIECSGSSCTCSGPSGSCSCVWDGTEQPCCGLAPTSDCGGTVSSSTSGGCDTSVAVATSSGAGGEDSTSVVATSSGAGGCGTGGAPGGAGGAPGGTGGEAPTSVASSSSTGGEFLD